MGRRRRVRMRTRRVRVRILMWIRRLRGLLLKDMARRLLGKEGSRQRRIRRVMRMIVQIQMIWRERKEGGQRKGVVGREKFVILMTRGKVGGKGERRRERKEMNLQMRTMTMVVIGKERVGRRRGEEEVIGILMILNHPMCLTILVNGIGGRTIGMNPPLLLMLLVRMIHGLEGVQRGLRRGAGNAVMKTMSRGLLPKVFK